MKTSEQIDKLVPALCNARGKIRPAGKTGENKFDRYEYATELDWHAAVMPALLGERLVLSMSIDAVENLPDRTTKNGGTEHCVQVLCSARVTHESGQWLEVNGVGQGQDRADKAAYKATTGLKKYLYSLLFALPTTEDPERDEMVGRDADDRKPVEQPKSRTNGTNGHANGNAVEHARQFVAFQNRMKSLFDGYGIEKSSRLSIVSEACRQAGHDLNRIQTMTDEKELERIERIITAHLADATKAPA